MSYTFYTQKEKVYLLENGSRYSPKELSKKLGRPEPPIRRFLKKNGIDIKKTTPKRKGRLTKEQEEFVLENYSKMGVYRMANKIKTTPHFIKYFLCEKGLIQHYEHREYKTIDSQKDIIRFAEKEKVLVRPPAIDSNPDYRSMYLQ